MLFKWIRERNNKNLKFGVLYLLASFAGGYLIYDYPAKFKLLLCSPLGQFITFMIINSLVYKEDIEKDNNYFVYVIAESALSVLILQSAKHIVKYIFK